VKKLVIVALSAVLAVMAVEPAHAEDQKVLAIIDTAVDSSKIPAVAYEACFTVNNSCPNKSNFMEGPGAANATVWPKSMLNATYHGYNMTQAALAINPNLKVVFVRVSSMTSLGNGLMNPASMSLAIKWLSENSEKLSIDAVSISGASISSNNLKSCSTDTVMINSIASLNNQSIPTLVATGNNGPKAPVGFPACVNGAVGVGALGSSGTSLVPSTSRGDGLDVVARGDINITRYNGSNATVSATSGATVMAAAIYVTNSISKNFNEFTSGLNKVLGYPFINR
jgi:hypothetical protein